MFCAKGQRENGMLVCLYLLFYKKRPGKTRKSVHGESRKDVDIDEKGAIPNHLTVMGHQNENGSAFIKIFTEQI